MMTNGAQLRILIEGAGLTQEKALAVFNETQPALFNPYSKSAWKAFLAEPGSVRLRPFSDKLLLRATQVFNSTKEST